MSLGADVGKNAVDELTTKTLPELLAGVNAALDRLERLLNRLDGASVVLSLGKDKS